MKTLSMYMTHFRLPDDFSGTIADAIRLMADYHENAVDARIVRRTLENDISVSMAAANVFDEFLDAVQTGKRFVGTMSLTSYDPKMPVPDLQMGSFKDRT